MAHRWKKINSEYVGCDERFGNFERVVWWCKDCGEVKITNEGEKDKTIVQLFKPRHLYCD